MARYGMDYGRRGNAGRDDWDRGFGGGNMGYGGMRSDARGPNWRDFPGEEGWYGQGQDGYPSGGTGYDMDFGGFGGGNFGGGGFGGGYGGGNFGGGYGGYRASGYGGGGYGGRDVGYGQGYDMGGGFGTSESSIGGRGGWSRGGQAGQVRAAEIMTENPETVTPDTTLAEVAQKMRDLDVGIIPVVESDQSRRLRGVVTDRDITIRATAEGKDAKNTRVSEIMSSEVETVNKNDRVRDVMEVMRREQVKRVPVTDREGRLVGIIAEADLLHDFQGGGQMVEDTLERVYEPGQPQRGGMAARGRGTGSRGGGGSQQGMRAAGSQRAGSTRREGGTQEGGQTRGTQTES